MALPPKLLALLEPPYDRHVRWDKYDSTTWFDNYSLLVDIPFGAELTCILNERTEFVFDKSATTKIFLFFFWISFLNIPKK